MAGPTTSVISLPSSNTGRKINDSLRHYHFSERLPAVSSAAAHRQDDSAVVRRLGGSVERQHALLPTAVARGIRVRAHLHPLSETAHADAGACGAAAGELRAAADS